jgi:hypothetical protein
VRKFLWEGYIVVRQGLFKQPYFGLFLVNQLAEALNLTPVTVAIARQGTMLFAAKLHYSSE